MNKNYPACNRILTKSSNTIGSDETIISVPALPLNNLLSEHLGTMPIDLLDIDCEGYDLEILQTLNFTHWKPFVIAAEDNSFENETPLCSFLESKGYDCMAIIGRTKIFRSNMAAATFGARGTPSLS